MALIGIIGNRPQLNYQLIRYAAQHTPSLIIDCANVADPHKLYPQFTVDILQKIYVIELELLYKFRDVLKHITQFTADLKIQNIIVTTSDHLFHYQDEAENTDIYVHAWEMLKQLGYQYHIVAGVTPLSLQMQLAGRFCDTIGIGHGTHSYFTKTDDRHRIKRTQQLQ